MGATCLLLAFQHIKGMQIIHQDRLLHVPPEKEGKKGMRKDGLKKELDFNNIYHLRISLNAS